MLSWKLVDGCICLYSMNTKSSFLSRLGRKLSDTLTVSWPISPSLSFPSSLRHEGGQWEGAYFANGLHFKRWEQPPSSPHRRGPLGSRASCGAHAEDPIECHHGRPGSGHINHVVIMWASRWWVSLAGLGRFCYFRSPVCVLMRNRTPTQDLLWKFCGFCAMSYVVGQNKAWK